MSVAVSDGFTVRASRSNRPGSFFSLLLPSAALSAQRWPPTGAGGAVEDDIIPDFGELPFDGFDLSPLVGVRYQDDPGIAIVDDVFHLFGHQGGIDGHGDAAGARGRLVGHDPLRTVLAEDDKLVSRLKSQGFQAQAEMLHLFAEFPGGGGGIRRHLLEPDAMRLGVTV